MRYVFVVAMIVAYFLSPKAFAEQLRAFDRFEAKIAALENYSVTYVEPANARTTVLRKAPVREPPSAKASCNGKACVAAVKAKDQVQVRLIAKKAPARKTPKFPSLARR